MFEFLFKYPATVFSRGQFVLLAPWPVWLLALAILAAGGALAGHVSRDRGLVSGGRPGMGWPLGTPRGGLLVFLFGHARITHAALRRRHSGVARCAYRRGDS